MLSRMLGLAGVTASLQMASLVAAQELGRIDNALVSVESIAEDGGAVGFRVASLEAEEEHAIAVTFGSLGNIVAEKVSVKRAKGEQSLRFGPLVAEPTPKLAPASQVTVTLYDDDPYPEVSFELKLAQFDQEAWEKEFGEVPFHFLVCSVPGAEIFHQRGWPIPTPVVDQYPQMQAEGFGRQVVSEWSRDWMYAPPIGAYPVPVVGLWQPSAREYVGYDFHEARLTDNSEKLIASSYCWELGDGGPDREPERPLSGPSKRLGEAREFFTLVWPYAAGYNRLRYPQNGDAFGTRFRLLHSSEIAGDDDPNRFVMERAWEKHLDLLPDAPLVSDVSWYPAQLRINDFPEPGLRRLYGVAGENARWEEPGAITAGGVGYTISPVDAAYRRGDQAAIDQLIKDIDFLLPFAAQQTIDGDECAFWVKPIEGEMARMFGPGVETIHNVQGWGVAQALLDTYRNDPEGQARLLPYVDGALRFTKHILYTRNGYPDVPAAQFAWGAGPVAHFCLSYYYTFRDDPDRTGLAELALKLARNMTYRYMAIWTSDNDQMDELDAAYLMEPNAGLPWLGAACANEIWVVCHALAEVYVATGDPILGQYLLGMLERWPILAMDEFHPSVEAQGSRWSERYGLFEGCQQGKGGRSSYGGIWGGFEQLSWPVGDAHVRVVCGEKSALVFNRGGIHTGIDRINSTADGSFSFRLVEAGAAEPARPEKLDVVVTAPFFDLGSKHIGRQREGHAQLLQEGRDYRTFPQRPDTVLIQGLAHGDTVVIGRPPRGRGTTPQIVKPRALTDEPTSHSGEFTLVNLASPANAPVRSDWSDPTSLAGFPAGRRVLYGVPFELTDPDRREGKAAVEHADIPVGLTGKTLFVLLRATGESGELRIRLADGREESISTDAGVPLLRGWPPLFEWTIDLVHVPIEGMVESLSAEDAIIFAVTVAGGKADLRETMAALRVKEEQVGARRRTIAGLQELSELFDYFAGHIAVLPMPGQASPQSSPMVKLMREAGVYDAMTFVSPEQLVDPSFFNAGRFWVTLYLGGERYYRTVKEDGDAIEALRRYLGEGGTLVALPSQPFPFYYDETGKPNVGAPAVGLPVNGSAVGGRRDRIPEAERLNVGGWETPPEGKRLTFDRNAEQDILTSLPAKFPFPEVGDPRWRPLANVVGEQNKYTPILTLLDEEGNSYGEGAAMIEYREGDLAGGRVLYVWGTLVHSNEYQASIVTDILRWVLNNTIPPPAKGLCYRAQSPITIDGKLDEPAWQSVSPLGRFSCYGTKRGHPEYETRAKVLWDDQNLYVAFDADDPDVWSVLAERDGPLWEGEVMEVYADPDGDGRDYLEFEVNPLNAVIDLKIEREDNGAVADWKAFAEWNAEGWKTAVAVDGDVADREGKDEGWTVEMAIPLANFAPIGGPPPKIGDTWRVQLYRIDRSNTLETSEYSGWSPTDTFHRPTQFGYLTFAGAPNADDFSLHEPGSSGAPMWRITNGAWEVVDGAFRGTDCLIEGWLPSGAVMAQNQWENFTLRLRFKINSRGDDWRDGPWIGFRYTDPGSTYSLNFSGRDVALHKAHGGRRTGDETALASAPFAPDNEWHDVEIAVRGAEISAKLDGEALLDATDEGRPGVEPVPAGGICLAARRWEKSKGRTEVLFDNVAVTPAK